MACESAGAAQSRNIAGMSVPHSREGEERMCFKEERSGVSQKPLFG